MQKQEPRPCDARRCAWCRYTDAGGERVRPLTPADLSWQFGEAEGAMGVRSTLGAFVDMALAGPPSGNGGRSNGVENQAVEPRRLAAVARHRCILKRLTQTGASPTHFEVLRAAYSPEDWSRSITDIDVRSLVDGALLGVPGEVVRVLPLTEAAQAHAARRQAPAEASADPDVVCGGWEENATGEVVLTGVHCAYRPAPPTPKPKKAKTTESGKKDPETPADKLKKHFREQPGLAGTAVGFVMGVLIGGDLKAAARLIGAGRQLVEEARAAAVVLDPPRSRRVRSVQLQPMPEPAEMTFGSEVL